jgi:hypothetical protein
LSGQSPSWHRQPRHVPVVPQGEALCAGTVRHALLIWSSHAPVRQSCSSTESIEHSASCEATRPWAASRLFAPSKDRKVAVSFERSTHNNVHRFFRLLSTISVSFLLNLIFFLKQINAWKPALTILFKCFISLSEESTIDVPWCSRSHMGLYHASSIITCFED